MDYYRNSWGQHWLTKVKMENTETGETLEEVDGVFYAIGHTPNSKMFGDFVETDEHGFIKVEDFAKQRPLVYG